MDWFWPMIISVATLGIVALATALYAWKLYTDFPEIMKAKVVSVEKYPINEFKIGYKYHFKGRNKGNRMMTDYITYKDKKFKVGEKTTVHMSKDGQTCHSNLPLWPAVTSAICILLAIVLVCVYVSETQKEEVQEEVSLVTQEYGHYIVTDNNGPVLFNSENFGLVVVDGDTKAVSTGDYGFVSYQGEPHLESAEDSLHYIHAISISVVQDGTVDTLDAALVEEITNMGYVINTVATTFSDFATEEHVEGDGHNHGDLEGEVVDTPDETIHSTPDESVPESTGAQEEVVEPAESAPVTEPSEQTSTEIPNTPT